MKIRFNLIAALALATTFSSAFADVTIHPNGSFYGTSGLFTCRSSEDLGKTGYTMTLPQGTTQADGRIRAEFFAVGRICSRATDSTVAFANAPLLADFTYHAEDDSVGQAHILQSTAIVSTATGTPLFTQQLQNVESQLLSFDFDPQSLLNAAELNAINAGRTIGLHLHFFRQTSILVDFSTAAKPQMNQINLVSGHFDVVFLASKDPKTAKIVLKGIVSTQTLQ